MGVLNTNWPPPPDLASIRELVRDADVEGLIGNGAPPDEYDTEADALHAAIASLPSQEITVERQLPLLETIWRRNFADDEEELAVRRPALRKLAERIAHFFGLNAQPQGRRG